MVRFGPSFLDVPEASEQILISASLNIVGFISSGKTKAKEVTRTRNVYEIQKED